jgi:RimJ/RimL family protein N-acetyltransferase
MDLPLFVERAVDLRLETPRLLLRRVVESDRATLHEHERDRGIMEWVRDPDAAAGTDARVDRMIEAFVGHDGQWLAMAIADRRDPASSLLGLVCVRLVAAADETVELGYRLHGSVQRRGLMHEACTALLDWLFGAVGVRRVTAMCVTANEPSWRLMEKLGMRREGLLREYRQLGGQWRDEYVYGLLRREWRA